MIAATAQPDGVGDGFGYTIDRGDLGKQEYIDAFRNSHAERCRYATIDLALV